MTAAESKKCLDLVCEFLNRNSAMHTYSVKTEHLAYMPGISVVKASIIDESKNVCYIAGDYYNENHKHMVRSTTLSGYGNTLDTAIIDLCVKFEREIVRYVDKTYIPKFSSLDELKLRLAIIGN